MLQSGFRVQVHAYPLVEQLAERKGCLLEVHAGALAVPGFGSKAWRLLA